MKSKNAIKLRIVKLDQSENYPVKNVLPEDGLYRHPHQPGEQHGVQKRKSTNFIWSKKYVWNR